MNPGIWFLLAALALVLIFRYGGEFIFSRSNHSGAIGVALLFSFLFGVGALTCVMLGLLFLTHLITFV